jgi:hypothetical protein
MTDRIALWLAALVIAVFAADALWFHWDLPVFLGRELARTSEWIAFWR